MPFIATQTEWLWAALVPTRAVVDLAEGITTFLDTLSAFAAGGHAVIEGILAVEVTTNQGKD
jgi:hypothetical protein